MATQVRAAQRWPRNARASAVNSGASAIVTSTLATVVRVSASMKAVYITHQQAPDSHSAAAALAQLLHHSRRSAPQRQQHHQRQRIEAALRQKVTSKAAPSSQRVTTPAMLHISVAASITGHRAAVRPARGRHAASREARLRSCSFR
jgi:hypothetical protein